MLQTSFQAPPIRKSFLILTKSHFSKLRAARFLLQGRQALHGVVLSDVELANGASDCASEEPLVDAIAVEEVKARHRAHLLACRIFHYADHALLARLVPFLIVLLLVLQKEFCRNSSLG